MEKNVRIGLDIDKIYSKTISVKKKNALRASLAGAQDEEEWTPHHAENVLLSLEGIRENFKQTCEEAAEITERFNRLNSSIEEIETNNQKIDFTIVKPTEEKKEVLEPLKIEKSKKVDKIAKRDYLDKILEAV